MKKFFSGLLVGLLLTTTVFASSEQIQATFADFSFVINGQVQKLQTKPLVYNGTSYLPVRDIANLLGYDVDYKTDTRTIEIKYKGGTDMPNNHMLAGNLVNLLADKYPELRDTISLGNSGDLRFNGEIYNLTVDYSTRTVDITPLKEAGILD